MANFLKLSGSKQSQKAIPFTRKRIIRISRVFMNFYSKNGNDEWLFVSFNQIRLRCLIESSGKWLTNIQIHALHAPKNPIFERKTNNNEKISLTVQWEIISNALQHFFLSAFAIVERNGCWLEWYCYSWWFVLSMHFFRSINFSMHTEHCKLHQHTES